MATPFERYLDKKRRGVFPFGKHPFASGKKVVRRDIGRAGGAENKLRPGNGPAYKLKIKKGNFGFELNAKQARDAIQAVGKDFVAIAANSNVIHDFFQRHPQHDQAHWRSLQKLVRVVLDRGWQHLFRFFQSETQGMKVNISVPSGVSFKGVLASNTIALSALAGTAAASAEILWNSGAAGKAYVQNLKPVFAMEITKGPGPKFLKLTPVKVDPTFKTWTKSVRGATGFGVALSFVGTELEYAFDDDKEFWSSEHLKDLTYNLSKGAVAAYAGAAAGTAFAGGAVGAKLGAWGGPLGMLIGFVVGVGVSVGIDLLLRVAVALAQWLVGEGRELALKTLGQILGTLDPYTFRNAARRDLQKLSQMARAPRRNPAFAMIGSYFRWLVGSPPAMVRR